MKKYISLTIAAVLAASAIGISAVADDEIKVLVNGEQVVFADQTPFLENDRTLVPMRAIFEALGATVEWDGETQTVISYDPISAVSIVMQVGSDKMFVNDKAVELDVAAKIVNDRTVVPVRAIAEGMSSKVEWDQENHTVIVTKDIEPTEGAPVDVANPWREFASLDDLNAVINKEAEIKYAVAVPSEPAEIEAGGYRYLDTENMAELVGRWEVGAGADMVIRTAPGDKDISGIYGGKKQEEYKLSNSLVEIYKYENTIYAVWSCEDAGTVFSHSVAVTASDFDATDVVKILVEDIETNHPKG
ncbi:MAG: copper amine oxidase N-terminal domain-containing protein [Clostridia bacterium]|nr:copper amine oxidase N-terminal domain-containing protein [Clostridia bacterium]